MTFLYLYPFHDLCSKKKEYFKKLYNAEMPLIKCLKSLNKQLIRYLLMSVVILLRGGYIVEMNGRYIESDNSLRASRV